MSTFPSERIPVTIRPACAADIPALCRLLADLFTIESGFRPDSAKQAAGLSLLAGGPGERACVLVATHEERIVGMVSVQVVVSTAEGGRAGLVEDLVVDTGFRGRGIGTLLLDGIVPWCRGRGLTRLQLLADRDNARALDFYAGRGWTRPGFICLRKML